MLTPDEFYLACNLTGNPFRSNPTYAADPRATIWVGYEKQKRDIVKFLERSRADQIGNTNFVMIYGSYGTGKSHALLWAQNLILHKANSEFQAVCYFIPTLRKDKGKLTFAGAFLEDVVAKSTLISDVQGYRQFLRTCVYKFRDEHGIPTTEHDYSVLEKMMPAVEMSSFAKEIFSRDTREAFVELLAPKGLNDYQAMTTFARLVNLFVYEVRFATEAKRFKRAAYLFIDELDDLLRVSAKEAREVNDLLRHLYDACPNCFGLLIALSAASAELPAIFEDFVLSRVQRQIVLELLDKDDAVEFVKAILDQSRVDVSKPTGFYPFDETAIDAICSQVVQITPRKIVNVMQQVVEEIRLAQYDPQSDGVVTRSYLDEKGILDEVLGEGGVA